MTFREKRLEELLAAALCLLDDLDDCASSLGFELVGYCEKRAALQAGYDAIR